MTCSRISSGLTGRRKAVRVNEAIQAVTGFPPAGILLALCALIGWTGIGSILLRRLFRFPECGDPFLALSVGLVAGAFGSILLPVPWLRWAAIPVFALGFPFGICAFRSIPRVHWFWLLPPLLFFSGILLMPPGEWDECVYQLTVPLRWLRSESACVYGDLPYSGFPLLPQFLFLPLIGLSGVNAAKAFSFLVFGCCFFALAHRMRAGTNRNGFLSMILMLAPIPAMLFFGTYGEGFILLLFFCGLFAVRRGCPNRSAALCGVLAGGVLAVKLTGIFPAAGLAVFPMFLLRKEDRIRFLAIFTLSACLTALPFYLRPMLVTGNPFYPYLEGWLPFEAPSVARMEMSRFHHALGIDSFGVLSGFGVLVAPLILGIPGLSNVFDGSYGFQSLLFLILGGFLLFRSRRSGRMRRRCTGYLVLLLLLYSGWYFSSPQARFLLPCVFLLAAVSSASFRFLTPKIRLLISILLILSALGSIHRIYFRNYGLNFSKIARMIAPGSTISASDLLYSFTGNTYAYAVYHLGELKDRNILLVFEERMLYLPEKARIATPLFQADFLTPPETMTPEKIMEMMRRRKIDALYVRIPEDNPDFNNRMAVRSNSILRAIIALEDQGFLKRKKLTDSSILFLRN